MTTYFDTLQAGSNAMEQYSTILDAVSARAVNAPEKIFCWHGKNGTYESITNRALLLECQAYADLFEAADVRRGDVVILIGKHNPWLMFAFLGAMMVGAIPSIIAHPSAKQDPDTFWSDCRALLDTIKARAVLVGDEFLADIKQQFNSVSFAVLSPKLANAPTASSINRRELSTNDVALLQHSSGTTGLKKGVMLSHHAILEHARSYSSAFSFDSKDIVASWLPLYHDMGLIACFLTPLLNGATIVWLDPFEWVNKPYLLLDAIEQFAATLVWLPNFAFQHIAATAPRARKWDLRSVRALISCSEPCKTKAFDTFMRRFGRDGISASKLQVCYAMAENVFGVTQTALGAVPRRLVIDDSGIASQGIENIQDRNPKHVLSCGVPIDGVEISIVDSDDHPVAERVVGEIRLRSEFQFIGYNCRPDLTAAKLRKGWYYSGDLGFVSDGELFVTGRKDDLLILYGRNYYAHDVEEVVSEIEGVIPGRVVAFGIEDSLVGTQRCVVIVEVRAEVNEEALKRSIRSRVEDKMGLSSTQISLVGAGWLAKTTSGKISRQKNREKFLSTSQEATNAVGV